MIKKRTLDNIPDSPGVYLFKDASGQVIYVGKAASLKKRVKSYFQGRPADTKTQKLINQALSVDYIISDTEAQALLYEAQLIKEYRPKYNIILKDDKAYPLLKLTVNELYPRLFVARRKKDDGAMYFGPYTDAGLLKEALEYLRELFPLRRCRRLPKEACLYKDMGRCLAPCVEPQTEADYSEIIKELILFLEGKHRRLIKRLKKRMRLLSEEKKYEQAARVRDQIDTLSRLPVRRIIKDRERGLQELKKELKLAKAPRRIEAFDVSNILGAQATGAMIVFLNGRPYKKAYRRFNIKTVSGVNDYAMMREIIKRRYRKLKDAAEDIKVELIVIDGGRGHLMAACRELSVLGLKIPAVGIAKEEELIYMPGETRPLKLPLNSRALHILQQVRDEAHRFALSYHHKLRKRVATDSILKEIKGVGPKRYKELIDCFGSLEDIRRAGIKELTKVDSINEKTAQNIKDYFKKLQ